MNGPETELAGLRTLVDLLEFRADTAGDRTAFHFLQGGEMESVVLNGLQLGVHARRIALQLREFASPGDRALLLFPPSLEFIAAFFGALYAGVIAVPCYPPKRNRVDIRLQNIVADAQPAIALAPSKIIEEVEGGRSGSLYGSVLNWLAIDFADGGSESSRDTGTADGWRNPKLAPEHLAFLQYTSGSTGTPKGVMVSHANLLANLRDLDLGWRHNAESVLVTWLPIFHDLGLIYGVLMPVYRGFKCYMMPPTAFLQRPWLWLNAISRFRGTHSAAPNFAYDLCVDSITPEKRVGLDLRSWQASLNGAEPVREETCRRFNEAFREFGLVETAICPGYGLAESTLKVASRRSGSDRIVFRADGEALARNQAVLAPENSTAARILVSCGSSEVDTKIVIVDPESTRRCPPGVVGEIWVAGQSVAQGYWKRPQASEEAFRAFTVEGEGPFLRTGDLGFLHDGELYITGRLKDTIIVRGFNHYPHDIEATAQRAHPALRTNGGAAFSVERDREERLTVIHEVERTHVRKVDIEVVASAVRAAIADEHQLQLHALVLVKPGVVPKTSSGKIQRRAAKALFEAGKLEDVIAEWRAPALRAAAAAAQEAARGESTRTGEVNGRQVPSRHALEDRLINFCVQRLGVARSELDPTQPLARYGMDSLAAVDLAGALGQWLGLPIEPGVAYDCATIAALAAHFGARTDVAVSINTKPRSKHQAARAESIAIIGMACRFPGASNPDAYWELLRSGRNAIRPIPADRPGAETFYAMAKEPGLGQIVQGGFLDAVDQFDAAFFGIAPREAECLDPQQRLLLEVSWEALEEAGLPADDLEGSHTGVFVGISTNDYGRLFSARPDEYAGTGNALSAAANRLSYIFDWRGPSMALDTACSSALAATHQACCSLRTGECDLALAGGVNLILTPHWSVSFARAGMLAPDGKCKTFDARADGYVRGEGCGLVVLQRLQDAILEGRRVLAVIRGSAVNQDGRSNGLTAPNGLAQREVISCALANAGIAPSAVSYVEAHGTGTQLGDPIELQALRDVLFSDGGRKWPCWIGSVKTNIGHLEAAAGVAGLIKVVLALAHRTIPPHLHLSELNPKISTESMFPMIPRELKTWESNGPRIAAVSSFGFAGTNAHIVLEEADAATLSTSNDLSREKPRGPLVFALSARSQNSLRQLAGAYRWALCELRAEVGLDTLAGAVCTRRSQLTHRVAVVGDDIKALENTLSLVAVDAHLALNKPINEDGSFMVLGKARRAPRVAFIFTGQGSQYTGMGRELYESEPVFRAALERCAATLEKSLQVPLIGLLHDERHRSALGQTGCTQPALFALEYALCELWRSWGVIPDAVLGHSVGEYAAACAAGVFDFETGLRLIAERARLMQQLPPNGCMAAVFGPVSYVADLISTWGGDLDVAAINGPEETVISGRSEAIDAACRRFEAAATPTQKLPVSHAFHSPLMEAMVKPFAEFVQQHPLTAPGIPFVSNVTGQAESEAVAHPEYWSQHVLRTVRFADGVAELNRLGCEAFVEIGPQPVLISLAQRLLTQSEMIFIPSLRRGRSDGRQIAEAAAQLFASGAKISWRNFYRQSPPQHVQLPSYPFDRRRYWLPQLESQSRIAGTAPLPRAYHVEWRPWRRSRANGLHLQDRCRRFIVVSEDVTAGQTLAEALSALGAEVEVAATDTGLPPSTLKGEEQLSPGVVYLTYRAVETGSVDSIADRCKNLLRLGHACTESQRRLSLWIVTHGALAVSSADKICDPSQTANWGFGRTAGVEHPELRVGLIDVSAGARSDEIGELARLLIEGPPEPECALRKSEVWVPRLTVTSLNDTGSLSLRSDATYLITGGAGALGRALISRLVQRGARHLVVLSRRTPDAQNLGAIAQEVAVRGGSLTVESANVADRTQIAPLLARIRESLPSLRGVFHLAGVSEDGLLRGSDSERFRRVLEGKAKGAQILHEETAGIPLDYFVCFSSAGALFGSVGQGAYATANAFLDGLTAARRATRLPGLSIQWGPWAGRGMNARLSSAVRSGWTQEGWAELDPARALDSLEMLLASGTGGAVAVVSVDWNEFVRQRPRLGALLGEFAAKGGEPSPTHSRAAGQERLVRSELASIPLADRPSLLREHVAREVRHVLGLSPEQALDPTQGFAGLGMDSMMAVRLRNRLQTALDSELPATIAYNYPTVDDLANHLLRVVSESSVPLSVPHVDRETQKQSLEEMSDEELAQVIALKYETLCCC